VTSIRASVYEPDAATLIAHLPRRFNPQFQEELNGDGNGQLELALDDTLLAAHPTLLDGGNVVKMRVTNAPAMDPVGWIIEDKAATRTDTGGRNARRLTAQGAGMRARPLRGGVVYPEYGLRDVSGDTRAFDFSSADGPWRVSADWVAPHAVRWDLDTTHRADNPDGWPDTNAYWLWSTDPLLTSAAGRNWFRSGFTLASAATVGIWASGDNYFSVKLDGEEILASDYTDPYGWKKLLLWTGVLSAGPHTLAASCDNTAAVGLNPAGFICVATTLDADGIPVTLLTRTDTTDWTVHGYAPPTPGWHAAQILKTLVTESVARSEMGGVGVTLGFTDTLDTDGVAWTDRQEMTLNVGTSLLDVLPQLTDAGMDVAMAHDYTLNAWVRRGQDLSDTLALLPGRDVVQNAPTVRDGTVYNSGLMRHGTGWLLVEDAPSIAAHGRRATGISTGGTDSKTQAQQTADQFFSEQATPQITLPFTITSASPGPKPYLDFGLGDVLRVPDLTGTLIKGRCMSISVSEPQEGLVQYEVDFYPEP